MPKAPSLVLVPIEPVAVEQLDCLSERAEAEGRAIPLNRPLTKLEQIALAMAYAWGDNPFRPRPRPTTGALRKAA
jgi:hypothetical protein